MDPPVIPAVNYVPFQMTVGGRYYVKVLVTVPETTGKVELGTITAKLRLETQSAIHFASERRNHAAAQEEEALQQGRTESRPRRKIQGHSISGNV